MKFEIGEAPVAETKGYLQLKQSGQDGKDFFIELTAGGITIRTVGLRLCIDGRLRAIRWADTRVPGDVVAVDKDGRPEDLFPTRG